MFCPLSLRPPPATDRAERIKGNLKYTTTREAIQNHFSLCGAYISPLLSSLPTPTQTPLPYPDPPPTVRLLTPKVTRAGATTVAKSNKSKGCAFLEFTARPALQAALRLHQSELDGRRINVELTAGGGGKSNARLEKVKARNKLLTAQRVRPPVFLHPSHLRTDGYLIDAADRQGDNGTRKGCCTARTPAAAAFLDDIGGRRCTAHKTYLDCW